MNKIIKTLAITALFVFPGISGFPQEVQQEGTITIHPIVQPVVNESAIAFPILIGIP